MAMNKDIWFSYTFTIIGKPVVLKNGKRVLKNRRTGKNFIGSSDDAMLWGRMAVVQLKAAWKGRDPLPKVWMNAKIESYIPTSMRADASNLYEAPQDALEKAGIISNDYFISAHDGSRRIHTKDTPHKVVITLTPIEGGHE